MKLQEICIINDALDGEDIFGLPAFNAAKMPLVRIRQIKEGLIEKGICEDFKSLSPEGERIVKTIMRYKSVDKYLQLGAVTLGIIDSVAAVMLQYSPKEEEYDFAIVSIADMPYLVAGAYPFVRGEVHTAKLEKARLSAKEFEGRFTLNYTNSFSINVWQSGIETSSEVFFQHDRTLYIYNRQNLILCSKTAAEMREALAARMAFNKAKQPANAV